MPRIRLHSAAASCSFDCGVDERILHAGLAAGFALPYECASGTCGKCRATLDEGGVRDLWPEAPGRESLASSGRQLLMCQSAPTGDVALEVARLNATSEARPRPCLRRALLSSRRILAADLTEITLGIDQPLSFLAGQFVLLEVPGVQGPRAYSMVNYEPSARELRLIVRHKPGGGFSEWLTSAAHVGEPLTVFGPLGNACFEPETASDVVCIAGGSGVAGMLSIMRSALFHRHLERHRVDVFFGVRTPRHLFYADELAKLSRIAGPNLCVTVAFSDEGGDDGVAGTYPELDFERGLVHEVAILRKKDELRHAMAFLAGPPVAVDAGIRSLVTVARMPLSRIRFDKYS